jgi:hypothetical protein
MEYYQEINSWQVLNRIYSELNLKLKTSSIAISGFTSDLFWSITREKTVQISALSIEFPPIFSTKFIMDKTVKIN